MQENSESFFYCAKRLPERHRQYCKSLPMAAERLQLLLDETERSQAQQAAIEAADTESFEEYLWRYFAQEQVVHSVARDYLLVARKTPSQSAAGGIF